jgi:L-ascorbate metabolism protein UlaG (beta-lactamase superfamily)
MIITYLGGESFKVSFGDTTLAFNPIAKESKLKSTRYGADIALITLEHPDMSGADQASHSDREPLVIRNPGEYEVRDVLIKGFPTVSTYGGVERINTVYLVTLEKMLILFLGALGTRELPKELKETLDNIDILFVPIGGDGVLTPEEAHKLAVSIEPKVVIPMHYGDIGDKDALKAFLKADGSTDSSKPLDKLTVKARDLEGKQNEIIVLAHE